jgi:signal transduction histidine kinase
MIRIHSLRSRMRLLFCGTVGVLLAGSFMCSYLFLAREARVQLDRELLDSARPLVADLAEDVASGDGQDISQLDLAGEYVELEDRSGHLLQTSMSLASCPLAIGRLDLNGSGPAFRTIDDGRRGRLRVALIPFHQTQRQVTLIMAMPTWGVESSLQGFRRTILILLPMGLFLTAVISGWFVECSLAPVGGLTRQVAQRAEQAARFGKGEAWAPITVRDSRDEIGCLARTFNQLFDRMIAVGRQLRRFVSDAAHEMRTPLAVLQGETDLALSQPRTTEEYEQSLQIIHSELKEMSRIVEGLFTLSIADARELHLAKEPLYLDEILEDACVLASSVANTKDISIRRNFQQEVSYRGDETFLRQLFLIFLDNAVKYSHPNTSVDVGLHVAGDVARVSFEDQGTGISAEDLPHIFERFYRAAQSGGDEAHSGGLGLAIAQAIVESSGGSIECYSTLGIGSHFIVNFPLADPIELQRQSTA